MCGINQPHIIMAKRIFNKQTITDDAKLNALLSNTVSEGDCKVWTRCLNTDGYPHMYGNVKVHRLVYSLANKKSDISGYVVRHVCDNPKCINPEHLILGSPSDNVKDMDTRGRRYKVITSDIVKRVKKLLMTGLLTQSEIAKIHNIDARRVSDIYCNKYDNEGKLTR